LIFKENVALGLFLGIFDLNCGKSTFSIILILKFYDGIIFLDKTIQKNWINI
jgi:hypothetical protein